MKMKENRAKEVLVSVLSFIMPLILMAVIWSGLGIKYNGEVTPLVFDMKAQYVSFFASLRYVLEGSSSMTFSWGTALGGNYLGVFAYYMASPLSWITVLFELENMPNAIYVLTLLKIGLCGLSFSLFLRFGMEKGKALWVNIVFACCYALMSYNMAYNMCLMWLDGVIFLPFILLGIEKLLKGKKGFVFFFSMAGLFISSYYISYMVGIFAAAYVLCRVFSRFTRENAKDMCVILARFGVNTVLALGIAMPLVLPGVMNLAQGKGALAADEMNAGWTKTVSVLDVLQKLLPVQYDSIKYDGLPYIYCGSMMCILMITYFLQKKHSAKDKVCTLVLLLLPFVGFVIEKVDYVWHAFAYPNCFLYRYAFLFSAMILIAAYKAYENIPKNSDFAKLLLTIGVLYTCAELYLNGSVIVGGINEECNYNAKVEYDFYFDAYEPMVQRIKEDEGWYRMDIDMPYYTYNDPLFFGVNGISYFSSVFHDGVNDFLRSMGAKEYYIHTSGTGLTPVVDSFLGVKYRISKQKTKVAYQEIEDEAFENKMFVLFENPDAMPLGYVVDAMPLAEMDEWDANPLINQNKLLEALGAEGVFDAVAFERKILKESKEYAFDFTAPDENPVYLFMDAYPAVYENEEENEDAPRNIKIYVNNELLIREEVRAGRRAYEIGSFEKGEDVSIMVEGEYLKYNGEYLYSMDLERYRTEMDYLKTCGTVLNARSDGSVSGEVTAKANQLLLTTIPYDEGYQVLIDGKKTEDVKMLNTFLAVYLPEGRHSVEVVYTPPGVVPGIMMGLFSGILLILYYGWAFAEKKKAHLRG